MARSKKQYWTAIVHEGPQYKMYVGYCTKENAAAWAGICLFDKFGNQRKEIGILFSSDTIHSAVKPNNWTDRYVPVASPEAIQNFVNRMENKHEYTSDEMLELIKLPKWEDVFMATCISPSGKNWVFKTSTNYATPIIALLGNDKEIIDFKYTYLTTNLEKAQFAFIKTTRKGEPKTWIVPGFAANANISWIRPKKQEK